MLSRDIFGALNKALHNIYIYNKKHINSHIRRSRNINLLASIATTGILLLSILILNPPVAPDDLASAATATPSTTSLTFISTNESASVNVPLRSSNGFFATSTSEEEASFAISTNNYTGYTLSIVASDDNGLLSTANNNGGNTTPSTISSISSITSTSNFSATTTAAEAYNGKWGFRPSKYVSGNNVVTNDSLDPDYLPSPTTTPTVLDKTTTATANNTPNEYTIALGVRVDYDVPAGTYNKTFSLVAIANPVAYSITYNKNTNDTVTNLPSTQASDTTNTTITLSNTVPQRAHYSFLGWCSTQPTTSNGVDSCSGNGAVIYNPNGNGTNLTYNINLTTTNDATLYAMWKIDTFTCTKQYRLENADGTWGAYQQESTETVNYGGSCSYTKSVTDYKSSLTLANNAQGTTSASNISEDTTLSLNFYRNVYYLTVSAGSNTSNPTISTTAVYEANNAKYFRWGQVVTVGITKATNVTCTTYATPTWTQTGTAGTFSSTSGASTTFTMGKGNATVTATSAASNVAQTITLSRSGGASGINIGGTNYTSSSVSLTCGTYNISGNYSSGYEFSSWSRSGSVTVANTSSASTTMTVSGPGILTLNAKSSKPYLQNFTASTCSGLTLNTNYTFYDSRDESDYTVARLADGNCWMTQNLRLGKGNGEVIALDSTNSDLPSGRTFNLKASGMGSNQPNASGDCNVGHWYPDTTAEYYDVSHLCINTDDTETYGVYYNWYTATAGTGTYDVGEDEDAVGSICPKGWRLPPNEGNKSYYNLLITTLHLTNSTAYATMQNPPYNFPLSGRTYGEGISDVGGYGFFWSSTAYGEKRAYDLYFNYSSRLNPQNGGTKGYGFSVRCVFRS